MSRRKKIKLKNYKYELDKKRDRIRIAVDATYTVLFFACLFICAIDQHNARVVGWMFINMGLISVGAAAFHLYIAKNEWGALFWYDFDDDYNYYFSEERKKDLERLGIVRKMETLGLILLSVVLPLFGLLRLLGII